jgi:hypothetical protein
MPLILADVYIEDTLWLATQDTGATIACGINAPPGPPHPVPYFGRQFVITYRVDSIRIRDAAGLDAILLGRLRLPNYASGVRDSTYDGRRGEWNLRRVGF